MGPEIIDILSSDESIKKVELVGGKVRAHYSKNLFLDVYHNKETSRYDFALIHNNERVLCWDNAPHHKQVASHPHHRHEKGSIHTSDFKGNLLRDLPTALKYVRGFVRELR